MNESKVGENGEVKKEQNLKSTLMESKVKSLETTKFAEHRDKWSQE